MRWTSVESMAARDRSVGRRNGIESTGMQGMAPQQPTHRESAAFQEAVSGHGLNGVTRAGRVESAMPSEARADVASIDLDGVDEKTSRPLGTPRHLPITRHGKQTLGVAR